VVKTVFAKTVKETISAAKDIGYPLVMKVASPQISNKSDIGGIRFPFQNASDMKAAYQDITESISKKMPRMHSLKAYICSQCFQEVGK
jgi:Acyl-CoA synthetase (NDP forming)